MARHTATIVDTQHVLETVIGQNGVKLQILAVCWLNARYLKIIERDLHQGCCNFNDKRLQCSDTVSIRLSGVSALKVLAELAAHKRLITPPK